VLTLPSVLSRKWNAPTLRFDSRNMTGVSLRPPNTLIYEDALKFAFINHGRSPAILTAFYFEPAESWATDKTLPTVIDVNGVEAHKLPSGIAIGPSESVPWQAPFNPTDFATHLNDKGGPYLYHRGFIRYRDLLDAEYITGFCILWFKGEFVLAGGEEHNFVRKVR
jgi:hypothetical protein